MNIGIDFYGTAETSVPRFRRFIRDAIGNGHQVFIISAIAERNTQRLLDSTRRLGCTEVLPVYVDRYSEHPQKKLEVCKSMSIDIMIDDRIDTCRLLNNNGIKVILYTRWKDFIDKWNKMI